MGRFLEVDKDEDGMAVGEYLRFKAVLDICKPLFRGITVEDEEGKGEIGAISNMNFCRIFAMPVATWGMLKGSVMGACCRKKGSNLGIGLG